MISKRQLVWLSTLLEGVLTIHTMRCSVGTIEVERRFIYAKQTGESLLYNTEALRASNETRERAIMDPFKLFSLFVCNLLPYIVIC